MVAIFRSVVVPVSADRAWAAVGRFDDPAALAPGFVSGCEMEDEERNVTFADGGKVREALVSCENTRRRVSYTAVGGRLRHHHSTMEVVPIDERTSRIDWVTDMLPDEFKAFIAARMDAGIAAIARGLSG